MELFQLPIYNLFIMYSALAFYHFVSLKDPLDEVENHKQFFKKAGLVGRIYISEEGINGQMSGEKKEIEGYIAWLRANHLFSAVHFKIQSIDENIFPRMTVKYRSQLVAFDKKVDLTKRAEHVSPEQWKTMLESGEYVVLDVRNQYEWVVGHFDGAELLPLETFREFPSYAEELSQKLNPDAKIMMYCTGGIRCEIFSSLLKERGFQNLYQLDGGVINYGNTVGSDHWKGKLFVFDDRLAISIDGKQNRSIATCLHCDASTDTYYNCANMDCNELFLSCDACLKLYLGCCTAECKQSPNVRPFSSERGNKPFRRKHLIV